MELDVILKKLNDMELRLGSLENEKENVKEVSRKVTSEVFVYDKYLIEYLNEENAGTFAFNETKKCYDAYLEYRKLKTDDDTMIATIRLFNRMVKERFPMLKINHINRGGQNVYLWDTVGE